MQQACLQDGSPYRMQLKGMMSNDIATARDCNVQRRDAITRNRQPKGCHPVQAGPELVLPKEDDCTGNEISIMAMLSHRNFTYLIYDVLMPPSITGKDDHASGNFGQPDIEQHDLIIALLSEVKCSDCR